MLGCVIVGTPARRVRAFSSGTRARLTISRATSAFSLFLRPGLGRFGASHRVDRDSNEFFEHYRSEQSNRTLIAAEQYRKETLERKLEALRAEKDKEIAALQQRLEEVEQEIEEAQWEVSLRVSS